MNFQTSYEIDENLVVTSSRQYFFKVLCGKTWIGILFLLIISIYLYSLEWPSEKPDYTFAYIFSAVIVLVILVWVKTYFTVLKNAKTAYRISNGKQLDLAVVDGVMKISGESSNRDFQLKNITKVVETKDFLVLMVEKLPVFMALKKALLSEQIAWILALPESVNS